MYAWLVARELDALHSHVSNEQTGRPEGRHEPVIPCQILAHAQEVVLRDSFQNRIHRRMENQLLESFQQITESRAKSHCNREAQTPARPGHKNLQGKKHIWPKQGRASAGAPCGYQESVEVQVVPAAKKKYVGLV